MESTDRLVQPSGDLGQAAPNVQRFGLCPHCGVRINPWRLLHITRKNPYDCPSCAGKAVIVPRSAMIAAATYVAVLAIIVVVLEQAGAGAVEIYAVCLLAALLIPLAFAWFCRFEPKTHLSVSLWPGTSNRREEDSQWH
jgi:hypothetical protein